MSTNFNGKSLEDLRKQLESKKHKNLKETELIRPKSPTTPSPFMLKLTALKESKSNRSTEFIKVFESLESLKKEYTDNKQAETAYEIGNIYYKNGNDEIDDIEAIKLLNQAVEWLEKASSIKDSKLKIGFIRKKIASLNRNFGVGLGYPEEETNQNKENQTKKKSP